MSLSPALPVLMVINNSLMILIRLLTYLISPLFMLIANRLVTGSLLTVTNISVTTSELIVTNKLIRLVINPLLVLFLTLQVVLNEEVGHLVRTKTSSSNEGGVAAGFAVLDSPLLASPGEGLLHPQLEQAAAASAAGQQDSAAAAAGASSSSRKCWGSAGGVLAVAKALVQQSS